MSKAVFPQSKLTNKVFYINCLAYFVLLLMFLKFNDWYHWLDGEDGPIENIGALFLFIASVYLFLLSKHRFKNNSTLIEWGVVGLAALAFFWAAGEEISWGQRLFGLATPEWLAQINGQKETNLHNINKKFFDRAVEHINWIMVLIPTIFHLLGKKKLFGFTVPHHAIVLAFVILPTYHQFDNMRLEFYHLVYPLFFVCIIASILKKDIEAIKLQILTTITIVSILIIHSQFSQFFLGNPNIHNEIRESIFSYLCLGYALQLHSEVHVTSNA